MSRTDQADYTADDDRVSNNLEQVGAARLLAALDPIDGSEGQLCPPSAASDGADVIQYHTLRE